MVSPAAPTDKTVPGASQGPKWQAAPILSREASATLRGQLLAELEGLEPKDGLEAGVDISGMAKGKQPHKRGRCASLRRRWLGQ